MRLLLEQAVNDDSAQVLVRSRLRAVSRRMGFADATRERLELICNEMMSNQVKYARRTGLVQLWETEGPRPAIDAFALDYGAGVPNLATALEDGFTTAGTMGKGLGAIRRLAHESEFYSLPQGVVPQAPWHGTAVWARLYRDAERGSAPLSTGVFLRAYQDDTYNGDRIVQRTRGSLCRWLHMDGLGHGKEAAEVGTCVEGLLDLDTPVEELMHNLSRRLKAGRGAVAIAGEVDAASESGVLCGVGDMTGYLVRNGVCRTVSFTPGILGHSHRSFEAVPMRIERQALTMTTSDGVRRNWQLGTFPGLWRLHPQLIALLLGYVLGRSNDDKSIFIVRHSPKTGE
jgi:anti-sigma regulatory factor (Ser/Thr protein kinase)